MRTRLARWLGIETRPVTHVERWISGLGAVAGIGAVVLTSGWILGPAAALPVVASMGASAVLLFAVPHSPLGQPWNVAGGHLISALVGVTVARWVPQTWAAAPLAVGAAVTAMHYLRCIHPPGGATALVAVIGGPAVAALGYRYVVTPVALNATAILLVAVAFNAPFPWRRYPAALGQVSRRPAAPGYAPIAHEDFVYALSQMNSFIDVSEDDLLTIYDLATRRQQNRHLDPARLEPGACYSNGRYGDEWSVRQIVDWEEGDRGPDSQLVYKVVAGAGRRSAGVCTAREFARWARHRVYRDEENWRRYPEDR